MKEIIEELSKLSKEIETAKKSVNQLEGRKEEILKRLKEEFQIKSIEEADSLLEELNQKILNAEEDITLSFEKLKGQFEW